VTGIRESSLLSGEAERLAGAASGPNRSIVWPSGEAQGSWPSSDAGEEMRLDEAFEVVWFDLFD
jgi:hypothetical protein